MYFFILAARRLIVAIWLSDPAIWAGSLRQYHLSDRATLVFAPPELTSRAEKTPRMTEDSYERPRQLAHLGYLFGRVDKHARNCRTKRPLGIVASVVCLMAFFSQAGRKLMLAK